MPTQDTTPSRRIVLSGLAAGTPISEMAISLLDEAGNALARASVREDGSVELPEKALASASEVLFEPDDLVLKADRFRELIEMDTLDTLDVTALGVAGGWYGDDGRTAHRPGRVWHPSGGY
jgi:uncharacterized protein YfaS (alpha-2-macroglobulin family)